MKLAKFKLNIKIALASLASAILIKTLNIIISSLIRGSEQFSVLYLILSIVLMFGTLVFTKNTKVWVSIFGFFSSLFPLFYIFHLADKSIFRVCFANVFDTPIDITLIFFGLGVTIKAFLRFCEIYGNTIILNFLTYFVLWNAIPTLLLTY